MLTLVSAELNVLWTMFPKMATSPSTKNLKMATTNAMTKKETQM